MVVPGPAKKRVLQSLHGGQCGFQKTHALAMKSVFWPGMSNHIKTLCENCDQCRVLAPAQQRTMANRKDAKSAHELFPMSVVPLDLFQAAGKEYLVMVNRFSGFFFVK